MEKSIPLILGLCATFIAAFSDLASPDAPPPGRVHRPDLPEDIATGEAEYEAHQRGIEQALRHVHLSNLDKPPEKRREVMQAWLRDNRTLLEEQLARSETLDALYSRHSIEDPKPSQAMARVAPRTPEAEASPAGRRWALDYEVALLREAHAAQPEALRSALQEWLETHGSEMAQIDRQVRDEAAAASGNTVREAVERPQGSRFEVETDALLENAPGKLRQLLALQARIRKLFKENPPPAAEIGSTATVQEVEEWREAIQRVTKVTSAALHKLEAQVTKEIEQELIQKYTHDNPN